LRRCVDALTRREIYALQDRLSDTPVAAERGGQADPRSADDGPWFALDCDK
jgi:hypothetical protein